MVVDLFNVIRDLVVSATGKRVRIRAQRYGVVSRFHFPTGKVVAVAVVGVVRGHVIHVERKGEQLAFAVLQGHGGLVERGKVERRLFYSARGIGRRVIHLQRNAAVPFALVGDEHLHRYRVVCFERAARLRLYALHFIGKFGIGETVTEGVLHGAVVIDVSLFRGGFVVLIAHIYVFAVIDIVIIGTRIACNALRTGIDESRIGSNIVRPGIHSPAGGIHIALEYRGNGLGAALAERAERKHRVYIVSFHEIELHYVAGIQKQYNVFKSLRGHKLDERLFFGAYFKIGARFVRIGIFFILPGGQVAPLAAKAADNYYRSIGKRKRIAHQRGIVRYRRLVQTVEFAFRAVQRRTGSSVLICLHHVDYILIDVKSALVERVYKPRGLFIGCLARAGAGNNEAAVGSAPAEHVELCDVFAEGQGVVLVTEHNYALFGDLLGKRVALCKRLFATLAEACAVAV